MAHVTSDCRAVADFVGAPAFATDNVTAAAWALMNGTDIEMGTNLFNLHLNEAVQQGLATEQAIDHVNEVTFARLVAMCGLQDTVTYENLCLVPCMLEWGHAEINPGWPLRKPESNSSLPADYWE